MFSTSLRGILSEAEVVGLVVEMIDVSVEVGGLLDGRLFGCRVGRRVGRRVTGRTLTVVVLVTEGRTVVTLDDGLLVGRRVGLGRLVVVEGGKVGACFFLFLFDFLPPDPNRPPNKSSPKRLKPV